MSTPVTPSDWPFAQIGERGLFGSVLMDNLDKQVDATVAEHLRTNQVLAEYPAWNFWAVVWFADGQFHADVQSYGRTVAIISADTPEEIMSQACEIGGAD